MSLPEFEGTPDQMDLPVLLKMGDDISTDEILRAGAEVLPYRSNIEAISQFAFDVIDDTYQDRALEVRDEGGHAVIGGDNYGQGSSREHAALAPRFLGLRAVIAKSYARIHKENLVNFGVLPLRFADPSDYDQLEQGDRLYLKGIDEALDGGPAPTVEIDGKESIEMRLELSPRQLDVIGQGGLINWVSQQI